jgi:outer membrane lipoprotein-sorting protein
VEVSVENSNAIAKVMGDRLFQKKSYCVKESFVAKKSFLILLFGLVFMISAGAQTTIQSGYDIMKKTNDKPTGNDITAGVLMKITSKTGSVKTREFMMYQLKQKDGSSSILIKFLKPADVKDMSFLTLETAIGEKSQYIYLPSLKKVTRIAASDKNKPFMGSDLTYDDFGSRKLEDYAYTLQGEETIDGRAYWKIESVSKDSSQNTSKIISLVGKESYIVLKADFYDKSGTLYKQMHVSKADTISGFWTMLELEMKNLSTGSSTSLKFDGVKYNTGLSPSMFSKDRLGQ